MIKFERFELENGLRVLVHEDDSTPMAAINIVYDVGSKDEDPEKTGFAHLFEHLMFGGSENVPDFDGPLQLAGGDSNAFTNNDMTSFYDIVPAENIETAFWLESDRMMRLNFSEKSLDVQRKVVVEEFKETCLNQPYGDVWHHLMKLSYHQHPYQWPTIGKEPKHIEEAKLEDVRDFFYKYYRPNNAILSVAGNVTVQSVRELAEKWFGNIPKGNRPPRALPQELPHGKMDKMIQEKEVPLDALFIAFHMPERNHPDYFAVDLLSDVLSNGRSARFYRRLLKEQKLFNQIDAYITGHFEPGLLIIEGKPAEGVSIETAEEAIWKELEELKRKPIAETELQKLKNKIESTLVFSEMNALTKAMNLAYFELLGNAEMINDQADHYRNVTTKHLHEVANRILVRENCAELFYKAKTVE